MAKVEIILDKEEVQEKKDLEKAIQALNEEQKLKFLGFLEGLNLMKCSK